ncbi:Ig-like domain-containing protein, partial [Salmonella enterica]
GAKTTYTADGKDTATWNATVADQYGNAVSGETVTWGGVTGAQPKYAAATTTTDASGHTSNTMTSTTAATNVKATATVSSTTHTGTPVTATTPIAFTADVSKATLTVTVTGSRQPTETDTSHTAATADGTDLLTLHFKAVDGNGNAVTSTPVHYTTAVTEVGIGQNTLACKTNTTGECTSTVKTTKAGTYNVGVALVPAGATQPVSPVTTALVFLAGQPDAAKTTASVDKTAANADKNETITVTLTPRDSHSNVVPLWTFRKDLAVTPSVNATVPGAVTVSTPTQDANGDVTTKLTYVDSAGQIESKAARTGTTEVTIGSTFKKTLGTAFYPEVHICIDKLGPGGVLQPGKTEVHLCTAGSREFTPEGYVTTAQGLSANACSGGYGVCPQSNGRTAEFIGLTGQDIIDLANNGLKYTIKDTYTGATFDAAPDKQVTLVYYGSLASPRGPRYLFDGNPDLWNMQEAFDTCNKTKRAKFSYKSWGNVVWPDLSYITTANIAIGGAVRYGALGSVWAGGIATAFSGLGTDTAPAVFVAAFGRNPYSDSVYAWGRNPRKEFWNWPESDISPLDWGSLIPDAMIFVNGPRNAAVAWSSQDTKNGRINTYTDQYIGSVIPRSTTWNMTDTYSVTTDLSGSGAEQKADGNSQYPYVARVNYVTGYVCAADL